MAGDFYAAASADEGIGRTEQRSPAGRLGFRRRTKPLPILSGCGTALGKHIRGEGLVGLTRGFMYAGVPRVVASYWQVRDQATAELMARFYHAMLVEDLPPAAALRAAQLALRQERRFRDPFYWAAFVLQGDWR